ncbi:hypothetical protein [Coleofasciculus sp. E1-EBD-02]|uniref:hypothetical protein n=1 Tax=Coleofasciculus sp. E1-EBD-02 TaxID=3068481 RepID=UPI0032F34911
MVISRVWGGVRAGFVEALAVDVVELASKPAPTLFGDGGLKVFVGLVAVVRAGFVEASYHVRSNTPNKNA